MEKTLYKLNNNNRLSWWHIYLTPTGYSVTWGHDLATIDQPTKNKEDYVVDNPEGSRKYNAEEKFHSAIAHMIERKGYSEAKPKAKPDKPMLAQEWNSHITKVLDGKRQPWSGICIQPKIDGHRCLGTNTEMKSRQANKITSCPHVQLMLSYLPPEIKLDGELFIPNTDLETVASYVTRKAPARNYQLIEYHVFDIVDIELPFTERWSKLVDTIHMLHNIYDELVESFREVPSNLRRESPIPNQFPIKLVETKHHSWNEAFPNLDTLLKDYFNLAIQNKYEGLIIRNPDGMYVQDYRSPDLLKYKERQDSEFEIIDLQQGKYGVVFVCKTSEGKIFDCNPDWTKEAKRQAMYKKDYYIGRFLTVEFERMSKEGKPLKPVGKKTHPKKEHE